MRVIIIFVLSAAIFDLADRFLYKGQFLAKFNLHVKTMAPAPEQSTPSTKELPAIYSNFQKYLVEKDNQPSDSDKKIQDKLKEEIAPKSDEFVFYLKDGSKISGAKQSEDGESISIKQTFGYSGNMVRRLAKADILKFEQKVIDYENITAAEIAIKRDFNDFNFYRKGIYSFFTDQDYFKIAKCVELLGVFSSEFKAIFGALTEGGKANMRCCVVVFGKPDTYKDFVQKNEPDLINSIGFYSPKRNCFFIYNFFGDENYQQAYDYVENERARIHKLKEDNQKNRDKDYETYQYNLGQINRYEAQLTTYLNSITFAAKRHNLEVLRHEAAHQLCDKFNMQRGWNFDIWVHEGLATFCETPVIGELNRSRLEIFKKAVQNNDYIALRSLFSYSDGRKFYNLPQGKTSLAYAQSWALFYYLMRLETRREFFKYLSALRTTHWRPMNDNERIKLLEQLIGFSLEDLEKQLIEFVKKQ